MGVYNDRILPWLLHLAMKNREAARLRARLVPTAAGRVLEIGIGSGLNLPFYGPAVTAVVGLDPSARLLALADRAATARRLELAERADAARRLELAERAATAQPGPALSLVRQSAEALPFAAGSFDTVVTTWTLCSIPDTPAALAEARRVLKRDGRLLFVEHGLAPTPGVRAWQDRLTPAWRRCAGGCHLNRPIDRLIRDAGFAIPDLDSGYLVKGPRPMTYHYTGRAIRA